MIDSLRMGIDTEIKTDTATDPIAVWCLTDNGVRLALQMVETGDPVDCFVSERLAAAERYPHWHSFKRLASAVERYFHRYRGHVFIMSTGIVVRMVAPLIRHKTVDPAVVVVDDGGQYAISLLSGHIGGANDLALRIGQSLGARTVVTTATDVNRLPAIDVMARDLDLIIENPEAIKTVNMAFLRRQTVDLHDPYHFLQADLPGHQDIWRLTDFSAGSHKPDGDPAAPGVFIDDIQVDLPDRILVLRPPSLAAGIGCNRNTPVSEIETLLNRVLQAHHLSPYSLGRLASISIKQDEKGLLELAGRLSLPIRFYEKDRLAAVDGIQNPSSTVEKYTGVQSVCEAAAILATGNGTLIVPKQTSRNVTVAIARMPFTS